MSEMRWVLKLLVGPWQKSFISFGEDTVRGAIGFRTKEEAMAFGKWVGDNSDRLRKQMTDEVEEEKKRTSGS